MKLRTKFIIIFILVILITGLVVNIANQIISKKLITEQIRLDLESTGHSRAFHIETLIENYKKLTKMASTGNSFRDIVDERLDFSITFQQINRRILALINSYPEIERIRVLSKNGIVIASSHEDIGFDKSDKTIFLKGKENVYIGDIYKSEYTGNIVACFSAPLLVRDKFAGVVILNFNAENKLFEILSNRTGQGETGETYLLNKDGYMISPSRFIDDVILKQKVDTSESCKCWELSGEEEEKEREEVDIYLSYWGKPVIGTHYRIEGTSLCLLAEMSFKEALAPINSLISTDILIVAVLLILSIIISLILSGSITKPIKKLHKGADAIVSGNLDYKVGTKRKDEIGQLSRAFDEMTQKLKISNGKLEKYTESLEEQVKFRTEELNKQFKKSEQQRIATLNTLDDLDNVNVNLHKEIETRLKAEEQIKRDLEEKNILLQEVHHRVKNNMQIVSSLLKLQPAHIKDKRALELFQNSQDRVKTMALIHDALYRSKDLANIDFSDYVRKLTTQIFISYGANSNFIKFNINIKDILLDISTAIPCGLIINELVSNSLKYAFPKGKGEISISFSYKNQVNTLCVKDNGIGISGKVDPEDSPTLGLLLVNSLTKQLDGTLKLEKVKGTSFKITFKKIKLKTYGKVQS